MITLKGLTKRFGDVSAVSELSFEVQPREVVGFLGPNGAGKTTTLRMLAGFLAPTSGTAELAGFDVRRDSLEVRRRIGYLPENNPLYEEMDAGEYLEWIADVRGLSGPARSARIRSGVEACGLGEAVAKPIGLLSKGFRQRLGLAAAMLHDPDILLLDEPTSGLDPNQTREVRDLILRLKEAKTVLISTHILPEVEAVCDRAVILHKGRLAAVGAPRELLRQAGGAARVRLCLKPGSEPGGIGAARAVLEAEAGASGVEAVDAREQWEFTLEFAPDAAAPADPREALFRLSVGRGWTLLELRRLEATFESVFRELTL